MDDNGEILEQEGATGDILVKSPTLMMGYVGNDEATAEAFDAGGWLRTGDVGQLVDGNKVFVVDRKKDLFKVRSWQVSPVEVEGVILQHPDITDAAVVGIPLANNTGEIPRAYIVLRRDVLLNIADLKAFIAKSLANYKIPEEIIITDSIPKNPTGKILRRVLRDQAVGVLKPSPLTMSLREGTSKGPWQYVHGMSQQASDFTRSLYRFLFWLRSFFCN